MLLNDLPQLRVLLYPREATPYRGRPATFFVDVFGQDMKLTNGDSGSPDINNAFAGNPTITDSWLSSYANPNGYEVSENVDFIRFLKDGTLIEGASYADAQEGSVAGFVLRPRIAPLDCKINNEATPDTQYTNFNWAKTSGTWKTVKSLTAPARTLLSTVGTDVLHQAHTVGNLPLNRSHRWNLRFSSHLPQGPRPAFRLMWGNEKYSLLLRNGAFAELARKEGGQWQRLMRFSRSPVCNLASGRYQIDVRQLGGRIVITLNGHSYWFMELQSSPSPRVPAKPVDATFPEGQLSVNCYNVRATIGVSLIKYADAEDNLYTGTVKRQTQLRTTQSIACRCAGWIRNATKVDPHTITGNYPKYNISLTASPQGVDTPFITKITGNGTDAFVAQNVSPLDVSPCITAASVSLASPGYMSGMSAQIQIDRQQLDVLNSGWQSYARDYNICTIEARWIRNDGSVSAWYPMMAGYVYGNKKTTVAFNNRTLSLNIADPTVRLQSPAAPIDHRSAPLDFLLAQNESARIYGEDMVRELLTRHLGAAEAARLVVRMPPNHYPMLDINNDTAGYVQVIAGLTGQPPMTGGFLFPAPFDSNALQWIRDIATKDGGAMFFYGWPDGYSGTWPVPCYGRERNFMATTRSLKVLRDAYLENASEYLMLASDSETRPDKDINRVLVWATHPAYTNTANLLPSARMAEARLPVADANSAEKSWERTMIIKDDMAHITDAAELRAQLLIDLLTGRPVVWPQLTIRGDASMVWGDRFQISPNGLVCPNLSDVSGGIFNTVFRLDRVEHSFTFGDKCEWTTSLQSHVENSRGF